MTRILANDGIHQVGLDKLRNAGFEVITEKIPQDKLVEELPNFDVVLTRSATKIRKELIDVCPNLKMIGRGGVGMDNIDVMYARNKGITVFNTPSASTQSVAELTLAHMFSLARFLHLSNRQMPEKGHEEFKALKKSYAKGSLLHGKKLGIIGFGRIGQALARMAIGIGMDILPIDLDVVEVNIPFDQFTGLLQVDVSVKTVTLEKLLKESDFISLHVPFSGKAFLGPNEMDQMKDGVILLNASRGGTIDEDALLSGLNSGKIAAAGLDVFVNEPKPRKDLISHPNVSVTPHIGASTLEAQEQIGLELADRIILFFENN